MRLVPSSPRARRRLKRYGIAFTVVGAAIAIAVAVRSPKQPSAAPAKNAPPAQVVSQSTHVPPADRSAIDRTLDRFLPAALGRSSAETAWNLAGPDLRGGTTLQDWRHGSTPIPDYPPRGTTFHNWTTIDAGRDFVDFNILIHPRPGHGPRGSSEVFSGEMVKRGGHWLVNGLYTIAVFARPTKNGRHEVGPADFAAGTGGQSSQGATPPRTSKSGTLGTKWLLVVGGVVLLALLFPLGFGVVSVIKSRRARRRYVQSEPRELPPLPRSVQTPSEPSAEAGVGAEQR